MPSILANPVIFDYLLQFDDEEAAATALSDELLAAYGFVVDDGEGGYIWDASKVITGVRYITQEAVWDFTDPDNPVLVTPEVIEDGFWLWISLTLPDESAQAAIGYAQWSDEGKLIFAVCPDNMVLVMRRDGSLLRVATWHALGEFIFDYRVEPVPSGMRGWPSSPCDCAAAYLPAADAFNAFVSGLSLAEGQASNLLDGDLTADASHAIKLPAVDVEGKRFNFFAQLPRLAVKGFRITQVGTATHGVFQVQRLNDVFPAVVVRTAPADDPENFSETFTLGGAEVQEIVFETGWPEDFSMAIVGVSGTYDADTWILEMEPLWCQC